MAKITDKWGWPSANYHPSRVDEVENTKKELESQLGMLLDGTGLFLVILILIAFWVATGQ